MKKREELIKETHEGCGLSKEAVALSGHRGRDRCYAILRRTYFWPNMYEQILKYCKLCVLCQKINPAIFKVRDALHPVGVPKRVMAQLGIDLCQLPLAHGKKYLILAIDIFLKVGGGKGTP